LQGIARPDACSFPARLSGYAAEAGAAPAKEATMKRWHAVTTCLMTLGLVLALTAKPALADKPAAPAKVGGMATTGTKWRVTTTVVIPNAPMAPPPMTYEFCQTETARVPQQPTAMTGPCKMVEHKFENRRATWKVRCEGEMVMIGEGSLTYEANRFAGEVKLRAEGEGESFAMTQTLSGQKIGTCAAQ
jgi:hypothetical protein